MRVIAGQSTCCCELNACFDRILELQWPFGGSRISFCIVGAILLIRPGRLAENKKASDGIFNPRRSHRPARFPLLSLAGRFVFRRRQFDHPAMRVPIFLDKTFILCGRYQARAGRPRYARTRCPRHNFFIILPGRGRARAALRDREPGRHVRPVRRASSARGRNLRRRRWRCR